MLIEEPWRAEEARQAKADMGAIRCDCCNGLIRKGDAVYSLSLGYERLSLCKECVSRCVSSGEVYGFEDECVYL